MENQRLNNLSGFSLSLREVSDLDGNVAAVTILAPGTAYRCDGFLIIDASFPPPTPHEMFQWREGLAELSPLTAAGAQKLCQDDRIPGVRLD